jgi:hypothetical protein
LNQNATLINPIITGTSTSSPITAAKAWPDENPNTATATAIASSKFLLPAVKESVMTLQLEDGIPFEREHHGDGEKQRRHAEHTFGDFANRDVCLTNNW